MKRIVYFIMLSLAILVSCDKSEETDFKPMYMDSIYNVAEEHGRVYAKNVKGYWMSYHDTREDFGSIYIHKLKDLASTKKLDLNMDLYYPQESVIQCDRPLLLLIHGGAFYNGDKEDLGYPEMGHYFAERGYVVASINYRLGFKPLAPDVDRAGYRAVQDAHAAVCYLIENAEEFGIDTTRIFAAGTSAGAITALNLAFMREKHRPDSTKENGAAGWISNAAKAIVRFINRVFRLELDAKQLGLVSDLGPISTVSDTLDRSFQIKAVVNMWGAVHDLSMLDKKNSPQTSILSIHGDADHIVPYGYGYPFDKTLDPYVDDVIEKLPTFMIGLADWMKDWVTSGHPINEWAFNPMHGSKAIHDKACAMGRHSELLTVEGGDHSLHLNNSRDQLTDYYEETILPTMTRFLCEEIVGGRLVQVVQDGDEGWYQAEGMDNVGELHWMVEGGEIVKKQGEDRVMVEFYEDAPRHIVTACGKYWNGVEFRIEVDDDLGED